MNNQFNFSFKTFRSLVGKITYLLEGRKYLLSSISVNNFLLDPLPFPHLLVPDDNSLLGNSIRSNSQGGECFTIPLADLKFLPKFFEKNGDFEFGAFLVNIGFFNGKKKKNKKIKWSKNN